MKLCRIYDSYVDHYSRAEELLGPSLCSFAGTSLILCLINMVVKTQSPCLNQVGNTLKASPDSPWGQLRVFIGFSLSNLLPFAPSHRLRYHSLINILLVSIWMSASYRTKPATSVWSNLSLKIPSERTTLETDITSFRGSKMPAFSSIRIDNRVISWTRTLVAFRGYCVEKHIFLNPRGEIFISQEAHRTGQDNQENAGPHISHWGLWYVG